MWDILSMIGSLLLIVLVLVLTYYGTRWYARRMGQTGSGKHIKVLERTALGAGAYLAVVRVGDSYFLLGVSDKGVRLVSELPDFEQHIEQDPPQPAAPFPQMLKQMLEKTREFGKKDDGDPQ